MTTATTDPDDVLQPGQVRAAPAIQLPPRLARDANQLVRGLAALVERQRPDATPDELIQGAAGAAAQLVLASLSTHFRAPAQTPALFQGFGLGIAAAFHGQDRDTAATGIDLVVEGARTSLVPAPGPAPVVEDADVDALIGDAQGEA